MNHSYRFVLFPADDLCCEYQLRQKLLPSPNQTSFSAVDLDSDWSLPGDRCNRKEDCQTFRCLATAGWLLQRRAATR